MWLRRKYRRCGVGGASGGRRPAFFLGVAVSAWVPFTSKEFSNGLPVARTRDRDYTCDMELDCSMTCLALVLRAGEQEKKEKTGPCP